MPISAGSSTFTVTATDGNGAAGSHAYSIVINAAIAVNPSSLPSGIVGLAYAQSVTATGGNGSYTFTVSSGALPPGLSLNSSTGAITGTPSSVASYNFTITATDGNGATGSRAYSLVVNGAMTVNPASLPVGTVGVPYSQVISAAGGTGSYTFSITAGTLPAGLALNAASGVLSGTPSSAATSNFTVTATDGNGATGARAYAVTINAGIAVNPSSLPTATVGTPYSQSVTATGGTGSYTFGVSAGVLPPGLALNPATGAITGSPTNAATSSFTITATDTNGASGSRSYSFTVNAAIAVNPVSLPAGTVGTGYNQTLSAVGGNGSYTYGVSAGALPSGLALNSATGVIAGTPTTAATSTFTVTTTDGNGSTGSRAYSLTIAAGIAVNPATLPSAAVGSPYSQSVSATGGTSTYTYSVSAGTLPAGLSLNASTGLLSGTPNTSGSSSFTITATDGNGASGSRAFTFTVSAAMAINPTTLPAGTVGMAYSQNVTASGGSGSYTYSVSSGSLPAGLVLNASTGAITGAPSSPATNNFTITATDSGGATVARAFAVTINNAIAINPASLSNGTSGATYSQTISATGGSGAYAYGISSGSLPAGLALDTSTGVISGTPTSAATSTFMLTATDGLGATGSRAYTVVIAQAVLTLESTTVGNGTVGSPYSQALIVSGGVAPYSYAISSGQLPNGVALNTSTGVLTGTPTAPGTYSFIVRVVDANGATGSIRAVDRGRAAA